MLRAVRDSRREHMLVGGTGKTEITSHIADLSARDEFQPGEVRDPTETHRRRTIPHNTRKETAAGRCFWCWTGLGAIDLNGVPCVPGLSQLPPAPGVPYKWRQRRALLDYDNNGAELALSCH
jgi:hypothetical protein